MIYFSEVAALQPEGLKGLIAVWGLSVQSSHALRISVWVSAGYFLRLTG